MTDTQAEPMTEEKLHELADRVAGLIGADRETDFLLAEAISATPDHWIGCRLRQTEPWDFPEPWPTIWEWGQPAYTASIDSAMTLVPEGWHLFSLSETRFMLGGPWLAQLDDYAETESIRVHAACATPAIALCCAALRAKGVSRG